MKSRRKVTLYIIFKFNNNLESFADQTVNSIKRYSDEFSADVKRRREDNDKSQQELVKLSASCQENSRSMKIQQKKLSDLSSALETQNGN